MSNKTTFEVTGVARLDVSQVKQAAEQIKGSLQGVTLPGGIDKNLTSIFQRLNDEIAEFEVNSKKATTNADWSNVIKSGEKILGLYSKMEGQIRQLGDISESEMKTLFPLDVTDRIKKAEQAIKNYTKATSENAAAVKKQQGEITRLEGQLNKKQSKEAQLNNQTVVSDAEYKNMQKQQRELGASAVEAQQKLEALRQKQAELGATLNQPSKSSKYRALAQEVAQAEIAYQTASQASKDFDAQMANTSAQSAHTKAVQAVETEINDLSASLATARQNLASLNQNDTNSLNQLFNVLSQIDGVDLTNVSRDLEGAQQIISQLNAQGLEQVNTAFEKIRGTADVATPAMKRFRGSIDNTKTSIQDLNSMQSQVESLKNSFLHFFSLTNGWMLLRRGIRAAYEAVKELDDAMTEIAVVSEYTLDDIWAMRDGYTKAASDMGAKTIDLVNATKLYVQQGMDLQQAQEVGIETTKMARIANLDGAEATNLMTAALRGFNMEMNEANRVNDVYSQLAAKSAADTEEIATAMSKTASIAANAGASFENTSAFLTQIIETTREAPETAGTALKTIIARFQELKKAPSEIGEVDGEMVDANKIETALQTAGVELRNAQGEFRNFDDVIIELAGKWDSLDVMTQRYIATMAAGSRQQSRFIALMADSERLMELTGYAANSAGASNEQFNKTLDSLESKINKLKNAWSLYLQNLANNQIIKGAVDMLTLLLETINNITAIMPGFTGSIFQAILTFAAFRAAAALISKAFATFGPMFFKQGQAAGAAYTTGIQAGIVKGTAGIKLLMAKIRAMFLKTKFIINPKVNIKPITMLMASTKKLTVAEKAYNAIQKSTTASTATKTAAEAKYAAVKAHVVQEETTALAVAGLNNAQIATYNSLRSIGVAADIALLAVQGGLNKKMQEQIITQGVASGLTATEIKQRLADAAATMAQLKADGLLGAEENMSLGRKAALAVAFLFANKEKKKQIAATLGLTAATTAETAADGAQAAAQWTVNIATYSFPGTWLLMIILAIIAAVALLVVGLVALADALTESDAEKMERLKANLEEAEEAADKASKAYSNLKDSVSEWEDGIDQINEMTEGTQEFRDAVMESNMKALELLDTYKALASGIQVGENGLITFSQESIDQAMAQAQMRQAITASNAQFANAAVKEEEQNQRSKTQRTSGDFTFTVVQEKGSDGTTTGEKKYVSSSLTGASAIQQSSGSTTQVTTHTRQGNATGYVQDGKSYGITYTTSLSEEQITDIAEKFSYLEEGTDSYKAALDKLSQTYKLEDEALKGLVADAAAFDYQIKQDELALEQLNKAAIAAAISLSGIIQKDKDKEIVVETIGNALTESAYDWAVGGDATTATYMGDTAIASNSGDSAETGMKNFQQDFEDVMTAQGQAFSFTNENSEGQTLIDMSKAINPDKEIKYGADSKHIDDEGEGLGDEFKQTAKTVVTQKSALILQDAMYTDGNEDLYNMLKGDMGAASLDYDTVKGKVDAAAGDRKEDYSHLVMTGIYKTEQDQQEARNKVFDRVGTYFGSDVYDAGKIADEYKAMEEAATALEEAYAAGESDDTITTRLKEYAKAVTDYEEAINTEAAGLYGEKGLFKNEDELMNFAKITKHMSDQMGSALAAGFSSLEDNTEARAEFIEYFEGVKGSAIATATAIREMSKSSNEDLRDAAGAMTVFAAEAISAKDQVHELYDLIGQEAMKELAQDGSITATEMLKLAKTNDKVQQTLDNTGISAHSLAKYYELLEDGTIDMTTTSEQFVLVLDKLNAATATLEDTFAFIDTFEPSRSGTKIGSYFNDIRSSMQKLMNKGAYGDQQLFDYAEVIVGQEELQKLIDTYGDLDIVMQKVMERAQFGENFYSSWSQLANMGSDMVSMGAGGSVQFNLENIDSVEALEQEIMSKLNLSETVAKAMIGDAQTFSANLKQGLNRLSLGDALGAWLNTAKVVGKKHILDKKELEAIAKQSGIDPEKIIEVLEEQLGDGAEIVVEPTVTVSGTLTDTGNDLIDSFFKESKGDINRTYKMMIDMGMNDKEAQKKLNELINDSKNVEFTFNGVTVKNATDKVRAELREKVAVGMSEGNLDPVVAAAQAYSAAQQAAGLSKGVAMGVAAGLGSAYSAFIHGLPPIVQGWLGGDKKIKTTMDTLIKTASDEADEASKKEVQETLTAYNNALTQQQSENNDSAGDDAAKILTDNNNNNANAYTNLNSQLDTGQTFDDKTSEPDKREDKWEEDYDWLYNQLQKQNKLLRERNKIEKEGESILRQRNLDAKSYSENLKAQEKKLKEQNALNTNLLAKRKQEMAALEEHFSGISNKYGIYFDEKTGQIHIPDNITQGKLNNTLTKEQGKEIDKFVSEMERVKKEMEKLEDDIADNTAILEKEYERRMESYKDKEADLIKALISQREKEIDQMEELNSTISDAASEMLDKIQTGIDDYRQAREDEEALSDIEDMESRLALMRSDTSGANQLDILALEKELQQARQDFMDNKIDQAIDQLSRQNELAKQQREKQIELMQWQLQQDKESGAIAGQANAMLAKIVNGGSAQAIMDLLKKDANYANMGTAEREVYDRNLKQAIEDIKLGWAKSHQVTKADTNGKTIDFVDKNGKTIKGVTVTADGTVKDAKGNTYTGIYKDPTGVYRQAKNGNITTKPKDKPTTSTTTTTTSSSKGIKITDSVKKYVSDSIWGGYWGNNPERKKRLTEVFGAKAAAEIQGLVNQGVRFYPKGSRREWSYENQKKKKYNRYETGGLADFTGPAWLDGTKARPEYVLNAEQTKGFLALVDMLGDFDDSPTAGGNNYYDVRIEVDELSNDYDVEQLMDKMKRVITDDAMYRNVNAIDLGRR